MLVVENFGFVWGDGRMLGFFVEGVFGSGKGKYKLGLGRY